MFLHHCFFLQQKLIIYIIHFKLYNLLSTTTSPVINVSPIHNVLYITTHTAVIHFIVKGFCYKIEKMNLTFCMAKLLSYLILFIHDYIKCCLHVMFSLITKCFCQNNMLFTQCFLRIHCLVTLVTCCSQNQNTLYSEMLL